MTENKDTGLVVLSVRVTQPLLQLLRAYALDAYVTESDFIRDAIREKIRRDAPELYGSLFTSRQKEGI